MNNPLDDTFSFEIGSNVRSVEESKPLIKNDLIHTFYRTGKKLNPFFLIVIIHTNREQDAIWLDHVKKHQAYNSTIQATVIDDVKITKNEKQDIAINLDQHLSNLRIFLLKDIIPISLASKEAFETVSADLKELTEDPTATIEAEGYYNRMLTQALRIKMADFICSSMNLDKNIHLQSLINPVEHLNTNKNTIDQQKLLNYIKSSLKNEQNTHTLANKNELL